VQEKESKEADGDGRNGRGARAANRNISEAQFG
jgi:hypothetical protein